MTLNKSNENREKSLKVLSNLPEPTPTFHKQSDALDPEGKFHPKLIHLSFINNVLTHESWKQLEADR